MRTNLDNLHLTGKAWNVENMEFKEFNLLLSVNSARLYEVAENDNFVGWFSLDAMTFTADYTIHTKNGMRGKSVKDPVQEVLIIDPNHHLDETPELDEVSIEDIEGRFKEFLGQQGQMNVNLDKHDTDDTILFISVKDKFVLIQKSELSVRIKEDDGIYVLKSDEDKESLTIVNEKDGVCHYGDKSVEIGSEGLYINNKLFNPAKIAEKVTSSIAKSLENLKF